MGAWGLKNFENDDALDFVHVIIETNASLADLSSIIGAVAMISDKDDSDYGPDAHDSTRALAAIELITALKGNPASDFPNNARNWVTKNRKIVVQKELIEKSRQAIWQVKANSELKELWEESDEYDDWLSVLNDLEERIG